MILKEAIKKYDKYSLFSFVSRDGLSRGAFYVASVYFRRWRTYYSEPRSAEKCTSDKMEHLVRHIEGFAVTFLLFCIYTLSYDPPSFHYILPYRPPLLLDTRRCEFEEWFQSHVKQTRNIADTERYGNDVSLPTQSKKSSQILQNSQESSFFN